MTILTRTSETNGGQCGTQIVLFRSHSARTRFIPQRYPNNGSDRPRRDPMQSIPEDVRRRALAKIKRIRTETCAFYVVGFGYGCRLKSRAFVARALIRSTDCVNALRDRVTFYTRCMHIYRNTVNVTRAQIVHRGIVMDRETAWNRPAEQRRRRYVFSS